VLWVVLAQLALVLLVLLLLARLALLSLVLLLLLQLLTLCRRWCRIHTRALPPSVSAPRRLRFDEGMLGSVAVSAKYARHPRSSINEGIGDG
jgi:hypothetical protein